MIGIIMATKGWILLVHYLEGCLEWFVTGTQLYITGDFWVSVFVSLSDLTSSLHAAFSKVNKGCEILCSKGLLHSYSFSSQTLVIRCYSVIGSLTHVVLTVR